MEGCQKNAVVLPEIAEMRRELERMAARRRGNVGRYVKWAAEEGVKAEALELAARHPGPFTQPQLEAVAAAMSPLAETLDTLSMSHGGGLNTWERLAAAFRERDGMTLEPRGTTTL